MGRNAKDKEIRQKRIVSELRTSPSIRISELALEFGVSNETIRRDLEELGRSGKVARTYGGAVAKPFEVEPGWGERHTRMREERSAIAALAAALVQSGDVLMIDAGSTVQHFAQSLLGGAKEITVITNGLILATTLGADPAITVIACPGTYSPREGCVLGAETVEFIAQYNATMAVVGASGITPEGLNDASPGLAAVKRAMFAKAKQRVLLADHGKFGEKSLCSVSPLSSLTMLVTDQAPTGELEMALRHVPVEILTPSRGG